MLLLRRPEPTDSQPRRRFLTGAATLSATAVALLVGRESLAQGAGYSSATAGNDLQILMTACGLELQAVGAYTIAAKSGLVQQPVLNFAVLFRSQHQGHADALAGAIRKMGGNPPVPKSEAEYAAAINAAALKTQADVLRAAIGLEKGAANAYIRAIPQFADRGLAQVAGRIEADEVMHWTTLAAVTGTPLPQPPLSWGA